jgi:hypothetical protein
MAQNYRLRLYGIGTKALIGEWEVQADERVSDLWADLCPEWNGHSLWINPDSGNGDGAGYGRGPHVVPNADVMHVFGQTPWEADVRTLVDEHGGLGVEWERVA